MSKHASHDGEQREAPPEVQEARGETGPEGEAPPPAAGPEAQIAALEAQLAKAAGDLAGAQDQYLRKAAEFENFRKRMNREKQDAIEFANQSLLLDLIPIIDDFERALKSAESSKDFDALHEGISMVEKRFSSQLENKWGLKRFDSAGEPFDPNRHEAIMMEKSQDAAEPVVAEDFIKGYTLKDRVVRAAKVKVVMPEEAALAGSKEEAPANGAAENSAAEEAPQQK